MRGRKRWRELSRRYSLVQLDRRIDENIDYVGMDNFKIAYKGAKYLLTNNHRRIGYIGWDSPLHTMLARNEGF